MTIRSKSILAIVLTFATIILLLWIISRFLLLEKLNKLENENALQDLNRVTNTLAYITSELDNITTDWALWDDTFSFIIDKNTEYIEANLVDSTFRELRLNYMIFLDDTEQVVFSKALELETGEKIPLPSEIIPYLEIKRINSLEQYYENTASGFIFPENSPPLLISIKPILDSNGRGPTHGTLIFGRFLGTAEINKVEKMTSLSIGIINSKGTSIPQGMQDMYLKLVEGSGILIQPLDAEYITGYILLKDITNTPGTILKIGIPRSISQEGQSSIRYFLIVVSIMCLIFGLMAVISAEKGGLAKLKSLADSVENIAVSGKTTGRLPLKGKDEISSLTSHINHMLASLQQSEKILNEKAEHLQTAVIEAQLANKAKSEFLSGVSHELRTPLTAIIGLGQLLQKKYYGNLNMKQLEYINDILDSSNHLLSLINDILDLAKIEAGKSTLELTEARVRELMDSSLLLVKESANKKRLTLKLDIPADILDQSITVDRRRFRQIMINLLTNAIKFTNNGSVTISAANTINHLEIVISDTGIGINNEEQKKIFDAFYQVQSGTTGKSPGTGLGLSLARRFVEQHQGKLWVESEGTGKGSRFHFTISRQLRHAQTDHDLK